MGAGKLLGKPNKLQGNDLRWTSILSRGSRNTPSRFMLQKLGISSGSYDPVGSKVSMHCGDRTEVVMIHCLIFPYEPLDMKAL